MITVINKTPSSAYTSSAPLSLGAETRCSHLSTESILHIIETPWCMNECLKKIEVTGF